MNFTPDFFTVPSFAWLWLLAGVLAAASIAMGFLAERKGVRTDRRRRTRWVAATYGLALLAATAIVFAFLTPAFTQLNGYTDHGRVTAQRLQASARTAYGLDLTGAEATALTNGIELMQPLPASKTYGSVLQPGTLRRVELVRQDGRWLLVGAQLRELPRA